MEPVQCVRQACRAANAVYFVARSVLCEAHQDPPGDMKPPTISLPARLLPWPTSLLLAASGDGNESSVDAGGVAAET